MRVALLLAALFELGAAHAVLSGADWDAKVSRDPDLAAAAAAVEDQRWSEAVSLLKQLVARRSWDDDAYTLLGYAHRKLGNYEQSLEAYHRALVLNPHHLGAMEYLGEAYLQTGQLERAREMLERIEIACRRTHDEAGWRESCEEWQELSERIEKDG